MRVILIMFLNNDKHSVFNIYLYRNYILNVCHAIKDDKENDAYKKNHIWTSFYDTLRYELCYISMLGVEYLNRLISHLNTYTPGTLMTSVADDVINHNGRKIGRFKPRRFYWVYMHISACIFA